MKLIDLNEGDTVHDSEADITMKVKHVSDKHLQFITAKLESCTGIGAIYQSYKNMEFKELSVISESANRADKKIQKIR